MKLISRVKKLFFGNSPMDDFEKALIDHLLKVLDEESRVILSDQVNRFNKIFRDDEVTGIKKLSVYFYCKYKGKNRRDFPLKFKTEKEEEKFATILVDLSGEWSGKIIKVDFNLVDGILFSMDFHSRDEIFRPLNPFFKIVDISFQRDGAQ